MNSKRMTERERRNETKTIINTYFVSALAFSYAIENRRYTTQSRLTISRLSSSLQTILISFFVSYHSHSCLLQSILFLCAYNFTAEKFILPTIYKDINYVYLCIVPNDFGIGLYMHMHMNNCYTTVTDKNKILKL